MLIRCCFPLLPCLGCSYSTGADSVEALLQQAAHASHRGEHQTAISRLSEAIQQSPKTPLAWYLRGREHFRDGKIKESVADFDQYVQLMPRAESQQWERGIAYYYAGEYKKGAK